MDDAPSSITLLPGAEAKDLVDIEIKLVTHGHVFGDRHPKIGGRTIGFYMDVAYHTGSGRILPRLWALVASSRDERIAELSVVA